MPNDYTGSNMTFVISGFDKGEPYGRVFLIDIPRNPVPIEQSPNPTQFGITWGGQREFVDRLMQGFDYRLPEIVSRTLNIQTEQVQALTEAKRSPRSVTEIFDTDIYSSESALLFYD